MVSSGEPHTLHCLSKGSIILQILLGGGVDGDEVVRLL